MIDFDFASALVAFVSFFAGLACGYYLKSDNSRKKYTDFSKISKPAYMKVADKDAPEEEAAPARQSESAGKASKFDGLFSYFAEKKPDFSPKEVRRAPESRDYESVRETRAAAEFARPQSPAPSVHQETRQSATIEQPRKKEESKEWTPMGFFE